MPENKKVLIVDDKDMVRDSLDAILEFQGFICYHAEDGETALQMIKESEYSTIFTDVDMGKNKMDGFGLSEAVRRIDMYKNTPIIVMTGGHSEDSVASKLRQHNLKFIPKPFTADEVIQKLYEANYMRDIGDFTSCYF